jgi:hypothetical protein
VDDPPNNPERSRKGKSHVALTSPVDGREQEFNEFYDNQHIPDVLALTGVRFRSDISRLMPWEQPARPSSNEAALQRCQEPMLGAGDVDDALRAHWAENRKGALATLAIVWGWDQRSPDSSVGAIQRESGVFSMAQAFTMWR